jgi:hypothetical protein
LVLKLLFTSYKFNTMKQIFTFISVITVSASAALAQVPARLTVFSEDGNPFYLVVNGIKQNDQPLTNVMVDGLTMPNYKVKVLFEDKSTPIDKNIFTMDVDDQPQEVAYRIKKNNKGERVMNLYSQKPVAQQIVYTQNTVPADMGVVNFRSSESVNNSVFYGSSVTTTTTTVGTPGGIGMNVNMVDPVTGENINMNLNTNIGLGGTVTSTTTTTTSSSQSGGYYNDTPAASNTGCMFPMNTRDFESAKGSIKAQSFDDTRLSTAKNIASSNCLSAQQVKDICQLFSFEDKKLEFAKFAYVRCTERNKFFIVNDVFQFSSNVDELNAYISGIR